MSWERLEKTIEWAGMSTHAFAMKIGMKRSENLYRIMRNKENVSIKLATLILDTYSQINKNWLIYGEGEMLVKETDAVEEGDKIPYYSTFTGNISEMLEHDKPVFNMYIPTFRGADIATTMNDRAMEPIIPFGAVLVLKEQLSNILLYGHIYYVITDDVTMVRIVRKSETSDSDVILEVPNGKKYDNMTISKNQIKKMYLVCGSITRYF